VQATEYEIWASRSCLDGLVGGVTLDLRRNGVAEALKSGELRKGEGRRAAREDTMSYVEEQSHFYQQNATLGTLQKISTAIWG